MDARRIFVWGCLWALVGGGASACGSGGDGVSTGAGGMDGVGGSVMVGPGGMGGSGCVPEEELCDTIDNDCDGDVDEDCACIDGETQPCFSGDPNVIDVGECMEGIQTCDTTGTWGACEDEVLPMTESCDGADNDCNGEIDEIFSEVTCGLGICQVTVEECVDGTSQPCVPGDPNPQGETCDGTDDDCDGDVDEGCTCITGATQACYTGSMATQNVGECMDGLQTCDAQGQWGTCSGDVTPSIELCDGLDNDCDGVPDENDPEGGGACNTGLSGICAAGTETCVSGGIQCVQNSAPTTEVCDGLDNDCDGAPDEGNPGGGGACNTGQQGVCAAGTQQCMGGNLQCVQSVMSGAEVCDGLDNDCDGVQDEGNPGGGSTCSTGMPGICSAGTTTCMGGSIQCAQDNMPGAEVCDGIDNDCDGSTDEGCMCVNGNTQSCYSGPMGTQGVGLCVAGMQTCSGGQWGPCNGEVTPTGETCNGFDDDCDGAADEGGPGGGVSCNTGLSGVCSAGTTACNAGVLDCVQNTMSSAETCNGLDDDCDGAQDEGNPGGGVACNTGAQGVCSAGTTQCSGGSLQCNQNQNPTPEVCNGLDDDCDGTTDEGDPGGGGSCNTGQPGICAAGTQQCLGGSLQCVANQNPGTEICDGLDNDCDGNTDEGNPGGGGMCNTGLLGVCAAGTGTCTGGSVQCIQNTASSAETCNGLDDDCDGMTDEGNPGGGGMCNTGQQGVCAAGTTQCMGGMLSCQQNTMAGAETCNGLDDDCDGSSDEGNPGGGAACNTGLPGVCAAGTTQCSGGSVQCNPNTPASAEVCDGLDNDCDGSSDEGNPGGGMSCNTGLLGVCSAGTTQCSGGSLMCNQNQSAQAEICPDSLDNDCDGMTDETTSMHVADPSFEGGPMGGFWTESSTNFGTPICDVASCSAGGGTGPRTGTYWAWFGGINATEMAAVSQSVTLPAGTSATLTFWLEINACDTTTTDTFAVLVDGLTVFATDNLDPGCGFVGYVLRTVDISSFADGGSHTLSFEGSFTAGAATTNFFLDDVAISVCD